MGFTTGFIGGLTLTTTLLYLSVSQHRQNRLYQRAIVQQQRLILDSLSRPTTTSNSRTANPTVLPDSRTLSAAETTLVLSDPTTARLRRAGFIETAKDRWNAEVEGTVRWLQKVSWLRVAMTVEEAAVGLYSTVREKLAEGRAGGTGSSS